MLKACCHALRTQPAIVCSTRSCRFQPSYSCVADIYTACFLQPVTQVTSPAEYSAGCTAITTKFPSGREQFTTFHPCAAFSSDCVLTAHMYVAWGMHGIIPGARDSLFSVQVSYV